MTLTLTPPPPTSTPAADPTISEALRRVVDAQIGPRAPGVIYENQTGAYEVLALTRDPQKARQWLGRRSAQWALVVKNVLYPDAQPTTVGTVWTNEDRVVREAGTAARKAG
jgi:hypothetical protein